MLATVTSVAGPAARVEQLVHAFTELKAARSDLEVGARGTTTARGGIVDTDYGVDLRLRCPRTGSTAMLRLSRRRCVLRAVSAVRSHAAAVSVLEDQLSLRLEDGYCWGAASFRGADEMAGALLAYMQARLAAVTAVCSPEPLARYHVAMPTLRVRPPHLAAPGQERV
jgi:hypothetical protein